MWRLSCSRAGPPRVMGRGLSPEEGSPGAWSEERQGEGRAGPSPPLAVPWFVVLGESFRLYDSQACHLQRRTANVSLLSSKGGHENLV